MNGWRSRLTLGALFWVAIQAHGIFTGPLPNTDFGMLVFHGTAALVDLLLLTCAPRFIDGRLCDDIQALCLASIVGNALGWAMYLANAPPDIFNTLMWGLSYVQWGRLLIVDDADDVDIAGRMGVHLVCRPHFVGAQYYSQEAFK